MSARGRFNEEEFVGRLSPPRIVALGPTGLSIEWTYNGRRIYRLFIDESMRAMNHEAIIRALKTPGEHYVLFCGRDGFARLGPISAVDYDTGDGTTAGRIFVVDDVKDSTEGRSWFELATFFMSREIREVVRGDILEKRAMMAQREYGRVWIEAATAVEIMRSFGDSWGFIVRGIISDIVKRLLGL